MPLLTGIFLLNIILIFVDASIGHHVVPGALRQFGGKDGGLRLPIPWILAVTVALYMFFNCLGFFRGNVVIILVVTVLVIVEILAAGTDEKARGQTLINNREGTA